MAEFFSFNDESNTEKNTKIVLSEFEFYIWIFGKSL